MKTKTIINFTVLCLLMLGAVSGVAAQDITVFPQLGHSNSIRSVAFSPDGKTIASGSQDKTMKIWDVASGREIKTFFNHSGYDVDSVVYSPDGKTIAAGIGYTVQLIDAVNGREIRTFTGHSHYVWDVVFSPDGKTIVSGSSDNKIKLWNTVTGNIISTLSGHTNWISSVVFSPDGKTFASGSKDKTIKLWDVASGREILTFSGHSDAVSSVTYSPDGKTIASGSDDKTVKIWDVASGREILTFSGHSDAVRSVAYSPDGKTIASGDGDGFLSRNSTVKLWDTATGSIIKTFTGHSYSVASVVFSPDGKTIASGSNDRSIKLWDVASGSIIRTFAGYSDVITPVAYSPDGKAIATGSDDKTVRLWNTVSGRITMTFIGHSGTIWTVVFSPDGKTIASGSKDKTIKLWDTATGSIIRTFTGHSDWLYSVVFSPDGKTIASGSVDKTVKLWDVASGREIRTFTGHPRIVTSVVFSPDGKIIASGSGDKTIKLWDITSGREIRTFTGHSDIVTSVVFSPNGKNIASGSVDKTVKLWDVASGREIRTFAGHSDSVNSVVFSPNGKNIASGSGDWGVIRQTLSGVNTVRLWNTATGKEIKNFTGHSNYIRSVAFSPDGKQILSGSGDNTTRLWDVATGKEIAQFISFSGSDSQLAVASRGLTVETQTTASAIEGEWLSITPDGYYQATPRGDRYLNVRVNNTVSGIDAYRSVLYNPDVVQARLAGKPDPASKAKVTIQQAASFTPPQVAIQSPANFTTTNTATTNLSVAITSQSQPIKNIKILVNGRLIGKDELTTVRGNGLQAERASLTVTGNQKTVNFTLPLELEPGNNRIEVVAFNGYSENRRYVDVTRNAPAGERPSLPNLWVVAVGVNGYDNAGPRLGGMTSLNFAVADAKGLVQSLKAQEGRRYAKVNTMLIADGEQLAPTAANIKQGFKFLEGADPRRDVVVLFLAGHGISAQENKFFFLPKDAAMNGKNVDANRAISGDEIMTVLDAPGNRLVFIDACQSGGVDNDRMVRSLMDTNAFVFAASRGNELSYESRELGHGFFTHSIMSALGGAPAALSEGRNVSVLSMSGFVKDDLPKKTGGRQNPSAYSLGFYDFPMAIIRQ